MLLKAAQAAGSDADNSLRLLKILLAEAKAVPTLEVRAKYIALLHPVHL